jgi:cytidyltransferase-like protein
MCGIPDDPAAQATNEALARRIHDAGTRLVLAAAGGGSGAIARLLQTPGASRSVLEAVVPYSEPALIDWLGGRPDQFCSEPTGRAMAMAAYLRAVRWSGGDWAGAPLAGAACTASLASDRPKRGPHRIHVAFQTANATASWSVELVKGRRTRAEEEQVAATLFLNAIARACGLTQRLEPGLGEDEDVVERFVTAPPDWQDLLAGRVAVARHGGANGPTSSRRRVVFPGAFNPLHHGHRRMAELARQKLGAPVEFEISVINVDKPPLDFIEMANRLGQFAPEETVWLTRAATFEEKSAQFPGATFIVGADTMRRINDARYHGRDPAAWRAAMERIAARGCRFLVFGRRQEDHFLSLRDLDLQPPLEELCQEVPYDEFHEDISSTEIRRRNR